MERSWARLQRRRLAVRTFLAVLGVTMAISLIAGVVLFRAVERRYIAIELQANRQIARTIAGLLEARMKEGSSRAAVLSWLQSSITDTQQPSGFVCLLDDHGRVLSHPDPEEVRSGATVGNVMVDTGGGKVPYPQLLRGDSPGGGLLYQTRHGDLHQLVNYWPVGGTPWRVSLHENVALLPG